MIQNTKIDLLNKYPVTYNFILCHKDSPCLNMFGDITNKVYLSDKGVPGAIDISCCFPSEIYGELPAISWIAQHIRPQDYACIHHYRRKITATFGVTVPAPMQFQGNLADQLAYYHSPVLTEAMLRTMTPLEQQLFTTSNQLFAYNIFQMSGEILQNMYLPYIMDKITSLIGVLGKNFKPDSSFFVPREGKIVDEWYQNRWGGFALERYNTLWWLQNRHLINNYKVPVLLETGQSI